MGSLLQGANAVNHTVEGSITGTPALQQAIDALEPAFGSLPPPAPPPGPPAGPLLPDALPKYQAQLCDSFLRSPGNEVLFLPTGLGECAVVDAVSRGMLDRYPKKHVLVCLVRPAQVLSHAERLRAALGVPVGAFCGGDFLYDFPKEFAANRVLVFTAGLLMRLAKLGTYNLNTASLLVLHDAFSAVRNHPMNTLVREYYWKGPGAAAGKNRPKILGVVIPQLQQLQRPFDKLRQLVRKLCHSAQAGVLVPTGPALEALSVRVHSAHVAVHAYEPPQSERELAEALQAHSLLVWDTLHTFGQNHFGRLIHFPPSTSPQASPQGPTAAAAAGGAKATPQTHTARLVASLMAAHGSPAPSSGHGSPASAVASPPPPGQHHELPLPPTPPPSTATVSGAPANAAAYAFDPVHHDWLQIELMVKHSVACSEALPEGGAHPRSASAIAVMQHVHRCSRAMALGMELGMGACLAALLPALKELQQFLDDAAAAAAATACVVAEKKEGEGGGEGREVASLEGSRSGSNPVDEQLAAKLREALPSSPLLRWVAAEGARAATEAAAAEASGSRMQSLLAVLREAREHAATREDCQNRPCSVAVVVGSEEAAMAVAAAATSAPDLQATATRWQTEAAAAKASAEVQEKEAGADASGTAAEGEEGNNDAAHASPSSPPSPQLSITVLTAAEAASAGGRLLMGSSDEAVWFSAADVLHAAGFDLESPALRALYGVCGVGSGLDSIPGPECHVLATQAQAAAWMEVCRADQLLLAAMQLVQAGDAAFENYLCLLPNGGSTAAAAAAASNDGDDEGSGGVAGANNLGITGPPPATALHALCLGLCGHPPTFVLSALLGGRRSAMEREAVTYQAVVSLPEAMLDAAGDAALLVGPFSSKEAMLSFKGQEESSEAEARDSAAEAALTAMVDSGLAAAYWQTRSLMARSAAAAGVAAGGGALRHLSFGRMLPGGGVPLSPFSSTLGQKSGGGGGGQRGMGEEGPRDRGWGGVAVPNDRLICQTCGIITTSEAHLREHLLGRRHLKNMERIMQQQGGARRTFSLNSSGSTAAGAAAEDEEGGPASPYTSPTRLAPAGSAGSLLRAGSLAAGLPPLATMSTIDRLPSTLSDTFLRRSSSLHRYPSGNVYEGFPCVRVGDVVLPSSMDLRAFLDEMQQAGELDVPQAEPLPPIGEEGGGVGGGGGWEGGGSRAGSAMGGTTPRGGPSPREGGGWGGGGREERAGQGSTASTPREERTTPRGPGGRPPPAPRPLPRQAVGGTSYGPQFHGVQLPPPMPPIMQQQQQQQQRGGGGGGQGQQQYGQQHHQGPTPPHQQQHQQQQRWNQQSPRRQEQQQQRQPSRLSHADHHQQYHPQQQLQGGGGGGRVQPPRPPGGGILPYHQMMAGPAMGSPAGVVGPAAQYAGHPAGMVQYMPVQYHPQTHVMQVQVQHHPYQLARMGSGGLYPGTHPAQAVAPPGVIPHQAGYATHPMMSPRDMSATQAQQTAYFWPGPPAPAWRQQQQHDG